MHGLLLLLLLLLNFERLKYVSDINWVKVSLSITTWRRLFFSLLLVAYSFERFLPSLLVFGPDKIRKVVGRNERQPIILLDRVEVEQDGVIKHQQVRLLVIGGGRSRRRGRRLT